MHNVELKLELRDPTLARTILRTLGATHVATMQQKDTYFRVPSGRLKKRECPDEPTEYIFYDRSNASRPRMSHFTIYTENEALTRFGITPLPVWVIVEKSRDLFLRGNVRVHIDHVTNLGDFLEFEALVSPEFHVAKCHEAIAELRAALAPVLGEPVSVSYSDLIAQEEENPTK